MVFDMSQAPASTGESIRSLRKLAGLSLDEVARDADTSIAYLSKVERGIFVPTLSYVAKVTSAIADRLKAVA